MNRTTKPGKKTVALLIALMLMILVPSAALADDAPTATLYSPSTDAAISTNQKIIFSLSEHVSLESGKSITLTPEGGTASVAPASSGTRLGNSSTGPWYVSYKLSDFSPALSLAAGTNYTVTADAGAFSDGTNLSAEASGTFTTSSAGGLAVIYTKTNSQTLQTGGSDIASGQAVASGSAITLANADDGGYVVVKTVYVNGSKETGIDFSSYSLSGDLEVYFERTSGALSGSVSITGHEYFGGELSADLSDINQPDTSGITVKWVRIDGATETELTSGGASKTYTLTADDLDKTIRLDVTDAALTGTLSATTGTITKAPYSGSVTAPVAASTSDTSITLTTVSGYEYSLGGTTWQDSPEFTGLTVGDSYDFYQRAKETTTTFASDASAKVAITTKSALTGTVTITGTAQSGVALTGSITGTTNASGTITYAWSRGATAVGTNSATYTPGADDVGSTLTLTISTADQNGTIFKTTAAVLRAVNTTTPAAPTKASATANSITLNTVSGYQYSLGGTTWQDSPTFSGLIAGSSYDFYQRVKETTTTLASAASAKATFSTSAGLTGTVTITGTAQSGVTLTGSITGTTNASGTITYTWQRAGSTVGTGTTYTPVAADIGSTLTLVVSTNEQSGTISKTTAAVLKAANTTTPAAPTMASATATTITLNAVSGYQYSLGGTYWQDTTTFHNLAAGSPYTFYQRVAETTTTLASAASSSVNFSTLAALTGTIMSSGEARYGNTIVVSLASTNNTGTLTYTWQRGTVTVGTGTSYAVQSADISNTLSLVVTSSVQGGSITRSFGTVEKAYYVGDTPDAPTRSSRTTTKIVLKSVDGYEYSRGGTTWQDSTTFSGLSSGTSYTFYQRVKATSTTEASSKSAAYKTSTVASSTSDDDEDTTTPTPKPGTTPTSDASGSTLYTYTLTDDNTRILYSTMKSLAEGNKTQDVTIKQSNVDITFPKGTMTDTYTQLWYDFGTTINNSIAEQTAEQLAGDALVATIHFNYSGELPGKANIRFSLGADQAGKTLYYYLLNSDNTLTFQQTATVDSTGWVTVSQTHCSDYVFLSQDYATIGTSPSPSPSAGASASPLPSPTVSPDDSTGGFTSDGWFIAAIILIAVALIVGGIWLYTKTRDDRMDDDDDDDDDNGTDF